jgi:hypothetical protein
MNKTLLSLLFFFISVVVFAQTERFPVFPKCQDVEILNGEACFKSQLRSAVTDEFKIPKEVSDDNFSGVLNVLFLVDSEGEFKVLYVNSPYKELKEEVERVFGTLPKITPAKYNNHTIEMQFIYPLAIPLDREIFIEKVEEEPEIIENDLVINKLPEQEVVLKTYSLFPEHKSSLNIPFTHSEYNVLEGYLNKFPNSHSAMKPYIFKNISKKVDLDEKKNELLFPNKTSWFGRKLLNEHMAFVKGKDYWFTINPIVDLQLGNDSEGVNTFNNTRGIQVNGGLGKNLNFSTSFYESQGRFAKYFNDYAELIKPAGGNPAFIPGRGIAKDFNSDAYDYPVAEAYISYTPNNHFNFQFGNGKNFIGDGYRSLFLSDVASPYPYLKINTNFWKIQYTNLWMWMQDIRPELTVDGAYKRKFMSIHYLSWNVSRKINLGLFEAVIWDNVNENGFDVRYLNPLIFYTAAEFEGGSRAGNALLGASLKYKLNTSISLYSQLLLDDFKIAEVGSGSGWWGNKSGLQLGAKYFNAFNVENLFLQLEYNTVRPYTYSHDELNYNYGHTNESVGHLWGANFNEFIVKASYTKDRWFANAKLVQGKKGFDFNSNQDPTSYGGFIYNDNDNRSSDFDNVIGQGNVANIFIGDVQVGYLVNPATNLKLFGGITTRNFDIESSIPGFENLNSTWFTFGLKTDIFNWYTDF